MEGYGIMEDITLAQIVSVIGSIGVIIGVYVRLVKLIKSEIKEHDVEFMPKVDVLIDSKLGKAEKIESKNREARKEKYELEIKILTSQADGCSDKIISIDSELKDVGGIQDRINNLENECKHLRRERDV